MERWENVYFVRKMHSNLAQCQEIGLLTPFKGINRELTREEMKQFWVGLMDAEGSIQCNHWRRKTLQFRLVIHMGEKNLTMLHNIRKEFGGVVRHERRWKTCLWVEDHQRRIWKLLEIFKRYPPLTSRMHCQIAFVERWRASGDVDGMLRARLDKYQERPQIQKGIQETLFSRRPYFPLWCTGFIEGKGCFSIRKGGMGSFSIGQRHDAYLITTLRNYFGGSNKCRVINGDFYLWESYKQSVLLAIWNHFQQFPLQGEKREELLVFSQRWIYRDILFTSCKEKRDKGRSLR